ncbi:RICIN domain-containing protein [Cryptosporangium japonicum]|uniref:RICIN domain-containing protein n=1 Tax=Cryptosporangium japonicum TaxID=80872 RepID=UPI0031D8E482
MSSWTSLEPASVPVEPGGSAKVTLTVRNEDDTVSEYSFSVVGAPAPWTTVEPSTLRLYPGARGTVTVTFAPPRTAAAPAGPTPYGVRVRSQQNQNLFDVAEGRVDVSPFSDVRAELYPVTVRGRLGATPRLTFQNNGNAPVDVTVGARDDEDALRFRPTPAAMRVAPGSTLSAGVRIQARGLNLFRGEQRLPFAVTSQLGGPGVDAFGSRLESRGTFVRRPLLPRWLYVVAAALVALALLSSGVYYGARAFRNAPPAAVAVPTGAPPTGQAQDVGNGQTAPPPPPDQQNTGDAQPDQQDQQGQQGQQQSLVISGARVGDLLTRPTDSTDVGLLARASQPARDYQRWIVLPAGDDTVVLVPATSSTLVLEQRRGEAEVRLRETSTDDIRRGRVDDRQKWRVEDKGNNRSQITNVDTGDCLTDMGTGNKVVASDCTGDLENQQRWQLLQN